MRPNEARSAGWRCGTIVFVKRAVVCVSLLLGCQVGTAGLKRDYPEYNRTIRKIEDEHMLLNLVRLRYFETPVFLQISSITTSYGVSVDATGAVAGGTAAGTTGSAGIGGSYSETPTITYSLADTREFFGRILSPLSTDQLNILEAAGGGTRDLLRLASRRVNGLENVALRGDEMIMPASYDRFREALELLTALEQRSLVDYAFGYALLEASSPFETLESRGLADGKQVGLEFYKNDEGKWVGYETKGVLHLRFSKASDKSEKAKRLRELLALDPTQYSFPLVNPTYSRTERRRISNKQPPAALDPDARFTEIVSENRSMLELMYFVAQAVQVPKEHLDAGLALRAEHKLRKLITIRSSKAEPESAAIRVEYKGYWFHIADNDLRSKATFVLLNALFSSTTGRVPGADPILTVPVR